MVLLAELPAQFLEALTKGLPFLFLTGLTRCRGGEGQFFILLESLMIPDDRLLDTRVVLRHFLIVKFHVVIIIHDITQDTT